MITSGSWRRMARRAFANVSSMRGLTWVWPMPGSSYSIGSSTVSTLVVVVSSVCRAAYSVVVLPLPVGPVTSTMPCGCWTSRRKPASTSPLMPRPSRPSSLSLLSSRRSTARSPCAHGSVETRTSIARWPMRSPMRPSCGRRRSAMSSSAMILSRLISAACSALLGCTTSRSVPSTRKRTALLRS